MPSREELEAELRVALARGKEAERPFREEADRLRAMLDGPYVKPVAHYWRHHTLYADELWHPTSLEDAYKSLAYSLGDGQSYPHGVSVGGHFTSFEELKERFGEVDY